MTGWAIHLGRQCSLYKRREDKDEFPVCHAVDDEDEDFSTLLAVRHQIGLVLTVFRERVNCRRASRCIPNRKRAAGVAGKEPFQCAIANSTTEFNIWMTCRT
jgi:hypothetical protein